MKWQRLTKRNSAEALMELQIKALGYPDAFVELRRQSKSDCLGRRKDSQRTLADEIIHIC